MKPLFFTNTFFEEELITPAPLLLLLKRKKVHFHLHYLSCLLEERPLLALSPEDGYLEKLRKKGFPIQGYTLLKESLENIPIKSFAPSEALETFVKSKGGIYDMPPFSLTKKLHSKEHTFLNSFPLPNSTLLYNENELKNWWKKVPGPKVLKNFFGASGRGHFLSKRDNLDLVGATAFLKNHPEGVVAEPWKERVLDFSTHWEITKDKMLVYLGATLCHNSPRGVYRKTLVAEEELLFQKYSDFLQEHLSKARKFLIETCASGFFGPIGIDAMLYTENKQTHLHPIVEVNTRQTMGSIALALYKKLRWERGLSLKYDLHTQSEESLLPYFAKDPSLPQKIPLFKAALLVEKANLICF
jgi:hypothetical protein